MTMTQKEFQQRWDSSPNGDGITFDEIAECAVAWGLFTSPKTQPINHVMTAVCNAAGTTT